MIQIQLVSYAWSRHLPLLASTFAATFPPLVAEQRESRASEGGGWGEPPRRTGKWRGEESWIGARWRRREEAEEDEEEEERVETEQEEVERREKKGCKAREWGTRGDALSSPSVCRSAEENVGDNLPLLRRFRLRTTNYYPFFLSLAAHPPACPARFPPRAPPSSAIRFVLYLGAYRSESLCIPMTTGRMHSRVQVNAR